MKKILTVLTALTALAALSACEIEEPDAGPKKSTNTSSEPKADKPKADKPKAEPTGPTETVSQQNARESAEDYIEYSGFSKTGLIDQLIFEGFSKADATYAANNCGAKWLDEAAESAQDYLDYSSFSRSGLIEQLEFEGFTTEQATYGADSVGL